MNLHFTMRPSFRAKLGPVIGFLIGIALMTIINYMTALPEAKPRIRESIVVANARLTQQ